MKKLLLLALMSLGLGAGVWKAQNPQGDLDDLKAQAFATSERLKQGLDAVRQAKPDVIDGNKPSTADRLVALETAMAATQSSINTASDSTQSALQAMSAQLLEQQSLIESLRMQLQESEAVTDPTNTDSDSSQIQQAIDAKFAEQQSVLDKLNQAISADQNTDLDQIDQQLGLTNNKLESFEQQLIELTNRSDADTASLDVINGRLDLLTRRLDEQTFSNDIAALREETATVTSQLNSVTDKISEQNRELSNNVADLTERTTSLGLRLDTLSASQSALASLAEESSTGDLSSATDSNIQDSVSSTPTVTAASLAASLGSLNAGIDGRLQQLEQRLDTVNSDTRRLNELNLQLETTMTQLEQLAVADASQNEQLAQIETAIASLQTTQESLSIDEVQASIRDQLAVVQSQIESTRALDNTEALEQLLDTTRERIQTLEQRVQNLPASSTEADEAQQIQSVLQSQMAALESRLETVGQTDPSLASTLSNVQEKVDELAAQEFVTQEDLRARDEQRSVEYKIYFDRNSAQITPEAAKVLDSFITQEKNRTTGVSIFGFTDRRGSAAYNQFLAEQRATNVRSYLIQNGFEFTKIQKMTGLGEDAAAAVLPDDADDAQQRVVILFAAQP